MASTSKKKKIIIASAAVIIAAGITAYFIINRDTKSAFEYEDNVTIGDMPGVDRDALLLALQENTDKAAVAFSLNSKPSVIGTEMNLLFENPKGNGKDITLTIYENDTGEVIYLSKAIREGNYLATISLLKEYAPGTYEATALITALDTQTHEVIGETAAGLTLQVIEL